MKKEKNAAVLFSGGKDSCLALFKAAKKGYKIKYLLSIIPSSYDSYMYHKPHINLLKAQAKSLGIPLIMQKSSAGKEEELKDLEILIKKIKNKVGYIVVGAVASKYQRERVEKIAKNFGLEVIMPLWGMNPEKLWRELLKEKFSVILTKIASEGIGKELLGQVINDDLLKKFLENSKRYQFHLTGEGGDFETAVLDCPLFKYKIEIKGDVRTEAPYRHLLEITEAN